MVVECPGCGSPSAEAPIVDTELKGRGSLETVAIRECDACGALWGEHREWLGVRDE